MKPAAGRERKWDMGLRAEWPCLLPATLITTLHDILFPKNARKSQQAFFILFRGSFVMLLSSQSWEHWQLLSFWFAISVYIMQELQGCCNPLWINESHKGLNWRMLRSFLPLYLGCWQQPHIESHMTVASWCSIFTMEGKSKHVETTGAMAVLTGITTEVLCQDLSEWRFSAWPKSFWQERCSECSARAEQSLSLCHDSLSIRRGTLSRGQSWQVS